MKVCRKCADSKESQAFPPNPRMRDGLHSWCRVCMALAARRWRERNAEKVTAYRESRRVKPAALDCRGYGAAEAAEQAGAGAQTRSGGATRARRIATARVGRLGERSRMPLSD